MISCGTRRSVRGRRGVGNNVCIAVEMRIERLTYRPPATRSIQDITVDYLAPLFKLRNIHELVSRSCGSLAGFKCTKQSRTSQAAALGHPASVVLPRLRRAIITQDRDNCSVDYRQQTVAEVVELRTFVVKQAGNHAPNHSPNRFELFVACFSGQREEFVPVDMFVVPPCPSKATVVIEDKTVRSVRCRARFC